MKPKTKRNNWLRYGFQWVVLSVIIILVFFPGITKIGSPDFEAFCPFGGLQALGSYFLSGALSCTMTSAQIVTGILLFAGILLFSKLFCSFICPVGTVSEWLGKLGDQLKVRFTIKGMADKVLRSLKYILLFVTFYFTFQSNELFCKKYDPYYGPVTGFGTDVVLLYAVISLAVVILGSVFIRLFWCKYLCPLGAVSNLFKFTLFFVAVLGSYLVLLQAGVTISYIWPLAIACAGGYIIELTGQSRVFPVAKIQRNTETCTSCQLCSKKCPQGIDVARVTTVKHVDCNLCGDCLLVCPEENTLTINKRPWLRRSPVWMALILVILALTLGSVWEIPTIDLQWAEPEELEHAQEFSMAGLQNIKCYGSSMAFANKMKAVEGIYGVATFVQNHRVNILYNPEILTDEDIQKAMFTPQKESLTSLAEGIDTICYVTLQMENFFDPFDFNYLSVLLKQQTEATGLISEFGCPVIVSIFFPEKIMEEEKLISLLESKTLTYETTSGKTTVKLGYQVIGTPEYHSVSRKDYLSLLFTPYVSRFNNREDYSDEVVRSFVLPLGKNRSLSNQFPYLVSHLSNDSGVVEFSTKLDTSLTEVAEIFYVDTLTHVENIKNALLNDTLWITYTNETTGKVKNMFDFSKEIKGHPDPVGQ